MKFIFTFFGIPNMRFLWIAKGDCTKQAGENVFVCVLIGEKVLHSCKPHLFRMETANIWKWLKPCYGV